MKLSMLPNLKSLSKALKIGVWRFYWFLKIVYFYYKLKQLSLSYMNSSKKTLSNFLFKVYFSVFFSYKP